MAARTAQSVHGKNSGYAWQCPFQRDPQTATAQPTQKRAADATYQIREKLLNKLNACIKESRLRMAGKTHLREDDWLCLHQEHFFGMFTRRFLCEDRTQCLLYFFIEFTRMFCLHSRVSSVLASCCNTWRNQNQVLKRTLMAGEKTLKLWLRTKLGLKPGSIWACCSIRQLHQSTGSCLLLLTPWRLAHTHTQWIRRVQTQKQAVTFTRVVTRSHAPGRFPWPWSCCSSSLCWDGGQWSGWCSCQTRCEWSPGWDGPSPCRWLPWPRPESGSGNTTAATTRSTPVYFSLSLSFASDKEQWRNIFPHTVRKPLHGYNLCHVPPTMHAVPMPAVGWQC